MLLFQEHVANKDIALRGAGGETKRFNICSCFLGPFTASLCLRELHEFACGSAAAQGPPRLHPAWSFYLLFPPASLSLFVLLVCPLPASLSYILVLFLFFPSPSARGLLISASSEGCGAVWGWLRHCSCSAAEPEGCPEHCSW